MNTPTLLSTLLLAITAGTALAADIAATDTKEGYIVLGRQVAPRVAWRDGDRVPQTTRAQTSESAVIRRLSQPPALDITSTDDMLLSGTVSNGLLQRDTLLSGALVSNVLQDTLGSGRSSSGGASVSSAGSQISSSIQQGLSPLGGMFSR